MHFKSILHVIQYIIGNPVTIFHYIRILPPLRFDSSAKRYSYFSHWVQIPHHVILEQGTVSIVLFLLTIFFFIFFLLVKTHANCFTNFEITRDKPLTLRSESMIQEATKLKMDAGLRACWKFKSCKYYENCTLETITRDNCCIRWYITFCQRICKEPSALAYITRFKMHLVMSL